MQHLDRRFCERLVSVLLVLTAMAGWPAHAEVREVGRGENPQIPAGSGLLLIAVDTDTPLRALRIKRNGALLDAESIKDIAKGRTTRLYMVPAGTYRWDAVRKSGWPLELGEDEEYSFVVRPGILNYPGDLIYRDIDEFNAMVHVANRGLLAMDWMDQAYRELSERYVLTYMGHYPDPFPAFYRQHGGGTDANGERVAARVGATTRLPGTVENLWKPSTVGLISLNPGGDLVAVVDREKRGAEWHWTVRMIDLRSETSVLALESPVEISRIDWSGNRALIVSCGEQDQIDAVFVLHVRGEAAQRTYERLKVPVKGLLVDPLPNDPDHILFASLYIGPLGADVQVHRLDISTQYFLNRFEYGRTSALDRGLKDDREWFTDAAGNLRAAIVVREESRVLVHGRDGQFREVMKLDDGKTFTPFGLSANGNVIYGWSEKAREQRDLVEVDPATGRIGRTLFSRRGVDVQGALFDGQRNLIGATFYEDGQLVSEYFDAVSKALDARLQRAFPGRTVRILDRDAASRQFLLLVGSSDQPSEIYHLDTDAKRAALLLQTRPWLKGRSFVPSHIVRTTSKDGFPIEAYLTLPKAQEPVPLVVLAHGGPIGVRDSRYFDPEVQFLAALGYAVLQVNFRGSEGYGSKFREAGKRSYGTLIEDDIDAALAAALAAHPLDRERMCAMGSSYGGYSALVSAIRWPGRFRCVVSIAGVSDRTLFFTASDSGRSKEGRKELEEALGDPRTETESMQAYSPLYRYHDLTVPVLLAHGTEDFRVDYEHTRRLARMLGSAGRPPILITLEGEAHGVEDQANQKMLWEAVAAFLQANLSAAPVARAH